MNHAKDGVRANVLDRVVSVADHDLAGHVRLAVGNLFGIAAERPDIVQDPFVVAALLFHVFEERVLIPLVPCQCSCQREKRKRMLHVMVSLRQKVEIQGAGASTRCGLLNKRNSQEPIPGGSRLGAKAVVRGHATSFCIVSPVEFAMWSCRYFIAAFRRMRPFGVKRSHAAASAKPSTTAFL